jgi:hypothetical protein
MIIGVKRTLHYDDAVRTLQGDAARIQQLVDLLVGAGMLALVGPFRTCWDGLTRRLS